MAPKIEFVSERLFGTPPPSALSVTMLTRRPLSQLPLGNLTVPSGATLLRTSGWAITQVDGFVALCQQVLTGREFPEQVEEARAYLLQCFAELDGEVAYAIRVDGCDHEVPPSKVAMMVRPMEIVDVLLHPDFSQEETEEPRLVWASQVMLIKIAGLSEDGPYLDGSGGRAAGLPRLVPATLSSESEPDPGSKSVRRYDLSAVRVFPRAGSRGQAIAPTLVPGVPEVTRAELERRVPARGEDGESKFGVLDVNIGSWFSTSIPSGWNGATVLLNSMDSGGGVFRNGRDEVIGMHVNVQEPIGVGGRLAKLTKGRLGVKAVNFHLRFTDSLLRWVDESLPPSADL